MKRGYIKLYRQSMATAVWEDAELWKLWTLCLMLANHKGAWVTVDGQKGPVRVEPGQFITGRYSLHGNYYPKTRRKKKSRKSPLTLWRWLKLLENLHYLNIKTNRQFSLITITNWKTYQIEELPIKQTGEQRTNNGRTTHEQRTITNKNELRMNKNEGKKCASPDFISYTDPEEARAIMERYERLNRELDL